jgi:hypothetical protein
MLIYGFLDRGKSPFHFENMWLKVDGFSDRVKRWWLGGIPIILVVLLVIY